MIDIWLIRYNNPEVENKAISLIEEHTDIDYTLHVFDNYKKDIPVSKLWNQFVDESEEYACLINSDAFVTKGWLSEMYNGIKDDRDILAVGPSGNITGGIQGRVDTKEKADEFRGIYEKMPHLSGYCLLVRKSFLLFPEEVPFYFNEIAWQMLASKIGFKMIWAKGAFVEHLNQSTVKKEKKEEWLDYQGRTCFDDFKKRFKENGPILRYLRH